MCQTLTCHKFSSLSLAQAIILLCVQRGSIFCFRPQVEESVLREAGRQAQLLRVRALDSEEEPVASDFGSGGEPHHYSTVLSHVGKVDISGSVGL